MGDFYHRRAQVRRGEYTCRAVRYVYTFSCAWCGGILKRESGKKSTYEAFDLAARAGWMRRKDGWKCDRCRAEPGTPRPPGAKPQPQSGRDFQGRRKPGVTRGKVRDLSLEGLSARQIAAKLKIRLRTVQDHRKVLRDNGELEYFDERAKGPFARSGGQAEGG